MLYFLPKEIMKVCTSPRAVAARRRHNGVQLLPNFHFLVAFITFRPQSYIFFLKKEYRKGIKYLTKSRKRGDFGKINNNEGKLPPLTPFFIYFVTRNAATQSR